jgi:hypothetical protein
VRRVTLLSVVAGLCGAAVAVAADADMLAPHLRYLDREARALVAGAAAQSPTVRRLVDGIEHSDVFVYFRMDATLAEGTANTRIMGAAAGARYVMVLVNPAGSRADIEGLLGHELQHVAEIAAAPAVRSASDLKALYERIGWPVSRGAARFETVAAIQTGRQVRAEILHLHPDPGDDWPR